jgi:hypothetical protein
MAEIQKNPFDLLLDQFRLIVRDEIAAALAKRGPEKLLYTTKETAGILNVEESWLATKARAGLVPFRTLGHYRYFSMADIEAIVDSAAAGHREPLVIASTHGQETARVLSKDREQRGEGGDAHTDPGTGQKDG